MASFTYLEGSADYPPTRAGLAPRQQSATTTYRFRNPSYNDLRNCTIDILGYTDTRVGDGRIRRRLPQRHNVWQWMFADSVDVQAVGTASSTVAASPGRGSPLIATNVPVYENYDLTVRFSPRNYNSWQDKDISLIDSVYYEKDDDGGPDEGGTDEGVDFKYATEWYRFTEWYHYPVNQYISAKQGQMVFRASGSGGAVEPNGISFQDSPKLYLPDSVVKIRWFEVPYRYVMSGNSYLTKFIGRVNQSDFGLLAKGNVLEPYGAGSLLYLGATPLAVYTPPVPDEGLLAFNFGDGFTRGKLCDLELSFLYTARKIGTATANTPEVVTGTSRSAANRNRIIAGHNLLPWLTTRKFYYATTYDPASPTDETKWRPSYDSFAFELLFTDPDAEGSPRLDP